MNYYYMRWNAAGKIQLKSSFITDSAQAPGVDSSQRVNTITITWPGTSASIVGSVCLDYIAVRDPRTNVTLTSSANPSVAGTAIHFGAHISDDRFPYPYGTVTLKDGDTVIASKTGQSVSFDLSDLSPGVHTLVATYSGSDDHLASTSSPLIQVIARRVKSDLNGDGKSDIVLQNSNPPRIAWWLMDGVSIVSGSVISVNLNPESMATGDLHRDGLQSFIWQNSNGEVNTGHLFDLIFLGGLILEQKTITTANPAWRVVASRDFTSDLRADLILRNNDTGAIALWQMNGSILTTGTVIGNPGLNLLPIDAGNFGGNAIIFQNQTTGAISRWLVNGTTVTSDQVIATPAAGWKVVAIGDFDGDGFDDLALQNSSTRAVAIWLMDSVGTTVTKGVVIATPVEGWKVVGAGDYDGNGRSDLLLHNALTNSVAQWQMNGTDIVKGWTTTTAPGWKPLGR